MPQKTPKFHCNACMLKTNHELIYTQKNKWSEDVDDAENCPPFHGWDEYSFVRCLGCDSFRFIHEAWDAGCDLPYTNYYPSTISRPLPKWLNGESGLRFVLSQTFVPTLLRQIYRAYHAQSYALAAMGIRSIIEQMMIDIVSDKGSFEKNLSNFQQQGYISLKQKEFLQKTIELGHAAIHRGHQPTAEDIRRSLDITEPILETVYVHEGHADHLGQSTPRRKKKN